MARSIAGRLWFTFGPAVIAVACIAVFAAVFWVWGEVLGLQVVFLAAGISLIWLLVSAFDERWRNSR